MTMTSKKHHVHFVECQRIFIRFFYTFCAFFSAGIINQMCVIVLTTQTFRSKFFSRRKKNQLKFSKEKKSCLYRFTRRKKSFTCRQGHKINSIATMEYFTNTITMLLSL